MPRIELQPAGLVREAPSGTPLRDLLHEQVEFPCGGKSACGGCRVRLLRGDIPISEEQEEALEPEELRAGWRLACCAALGAENVTLDVAQWEMEVLTDAAHIASPNRATGKAVAVDIGTTTVVAQMLDLGSGEVLGVATALNPQAAFGADIMTRVEAGATDPSIAEQLRELIRHAVRDLIFSLPHKGTIERVLLAGNSVMHHLYCGLDLEPFTRAPFELNDGASHTHHCRKLDADMTFLGCLGGFVGSDIAAGILATGMHHSDRLQVLVDLGTNGEIVVGDRSRLLCASTAAGPAFEGGRIGMGMRAASGAISSVSVRDGTGTLDVSVLGGGPPRGICGSGLVDAVAAGISTGAILPNGRLREGREWMIASPVLLRQRDIRELQLAKGAIAAGIEVLLRRFGATTGDVSRFYLAGAFGNYIDATSAWRIGLLPVEPSRITAAGNTSLRGTKMALFDSTQLDAIQAITEHVPLGADAEFQDLFVAKMALTPPA